MPTSTLSKMNSRAEIDEPFTLHRRPQFFVEA